MSRAILKARIKAFNFKFKAEKLNDKNKLSNQIDKIKERVLLKFKNNIIMHDTKIHWGDIDDFINDLYTLRIKVYINE